MRALRLVSDRKLEIAEVDPPPPPGEGEVQIKTHAIALNHIDVWGWRGMAFAKRKMPLVVGAEAAGEIAAVGPGVKRFKAGRSRVTPYGALTCGKCKACLRGPRQSLRGCVNGVSGFHVDGFARELYNHPARLVVPAPKGISPTDAACAPLTFRHRRAHAVRQREAAAGRDRARARGRLRHRHGRDPDSRKHIGATVITTVGDDEKAEKAKAIGADHVINYKTDRFEHLVRKITRRKASTSCSSIPAPTPGTARCLSMKRGGTARHLRRDLGPGRQDQLDAAVPAAV